MEPMLEAIRGRLAALVEAAGRADAALLNLAPETVPPIGLAKALVWAERVAGEAADLARHAEDSCRRAAAPKG